MALILIADDDRLTRETLATLLTAEGHEVHLASSAAQLLELSCQYPHFDLVLTDLKMPRVDGIQLLETIRLQRPHARVIIMSAFSTADTVVAALRRGVADYLQKPFDWKELQEALARALSGAPSTAPQQRQVTDDDS